MPPKELLSVPQLKEPEFHSKNVNMISPLPSAKSSQKSNPLSALFAARTSENGGEQNTTGANMSKLNQNMLAEAI